MGVGVDAEAGLIRVSGREEDVLVELVESVAVMAVSDSGRRPPISPALLSPLFSPLFSSHMRITFSKDMRELEDES